MLAQWIGDIIGKMHLYGIKSKDLAAQVGWHPKYLSAVLNGHRQPKNAQKMLEDAINALIIKEN